MKFTEAFYRHILIPAFESGWHRRRTFQYLRELEESQWWEFDRHQERQELVLSSLLRHAAQTCEYYREQWNQIGFKPESLTSIHDLRRLPILSRETIQENVSKLRSAKPGFRLISKTTGGSTGLPLKFDLDTNSNDRRVAAALRGYGWASAGAGTKQFHLWSGPIGKVPLWRRWKDKLYHSIHRRTMVSSYGMQESRVDWYLNRLNRNRPDVIVAYVNPLYEFARFLDERDLRPWRPNTIVVGAEKLHPFQRSVIERVFDAPVFETYGSREFMLIGAECPEHNGLHITAESHIVEILDENGEPAADGEMGNVVVTDLTNYGMPFIRYLTGDQAIAGWGKCRCGRGLPVLRKVVGRQLDILRTPDGRRIPGEFFISLLMGREAIRRFQVTQHSEGEIVLRVVSKCGLDKVERENIESDCLDILGPEVRFSIEEVADIPLTAMGKQRVVVNRTAATPSEDRLVAQNIRD